jgi:hypothetical protein
MEFAIWLLLAILTLHRQTLVKDCGPAATKSKKAIAKNRPSGTSPDNKLLEFKTRTARKSGSLHTSICTYGRMRPVRSDGGESGNPASP